MTNVSGTPIENINLGNTKIRRFPNGHVFWYYIEVDGLNIRIDKTLYKTIKRLKMDGRELS